ncbi:hypothetical protein SKAU_G00283600 [Synaphobranchus kaupii]|uniref:Uncharacterized protein n=1 Tax=Synaphobranchus kaupii TaxID=118154 RepID=A0A9Q1IN86_SYNKA|nr:hypothetical protein SKAU_G00283600 [Synaphobranchus kaupii]
MGRMRNDWNREASWTNKTEIRLRKSEKQLKKIGPDNDTEVFVDLFERTSTAHVWPLSEGALRLIPLLSGESQIVAHHVRTSTVATILERVGLKPEGHHLRLREL